MNRLQDVLLAVLLCSSAFCQDSGQQAARLAPLVNGTLPNAAAFRNAAVGQPSADAASGRLRKPAEAAPTSNTTAPTGILRLGLSTSGRDGYVFVPPSYRQEVASALIVALHGAGKGGLDGLGVLIDQANSSGILLLAPDSRGATWDWFTSSAFGGDVVFIGAALAQTRALYNIDPGRTGMEGFSDGATYALSLGLANGNLFSRVMANSPGGILPIMPQGCPPVYVSAGVQDNIFPIGEGGDSVVCQLQSSGYSVTYNRFQGAHVLPPAVAAGMVSWFLGRGASNSSASPLCPGST